MMDFGHGGHPNSLGIQKSVLEEKEYKSIVCASVMSDSWQPHGLQPARLPCPCDSPGKNTGVCCHSLLPVNLPDPRIKLISLVAPALQADSLLLSHWGSPRGLVQDLNQGPLAP